MKVLEFLDLMKDDTTPGNSAFIFGNDVSAMFLFPVV